VPAGLAQRLARDEHAGSGDESPLDRLGEAEIGAAGVADGGEAAAQHARQYRTRLMGEEGHRQGREDREIGLDGDGVDMGVDEAGHQRLALEVDDCGAGGFDRPVGDLADRLALDDDVMPRQQRAGDRVEHRAVLEMNETHRPLPKRIIAARLCLGGAAYCASWPGPRRRFALFSARMVKAGSPHSARVSWR
jgi:hypothetical protein